MSADSLILVPAVGALAYAFLLFVIRRRATTSAGVVQFEILLSLLVISSTVSVVWHVTKSDPAWSDPLLRVLTWSDLSVAPALLAFVASRFKGVWSRVAGLASIVIAGAILLVALSGSMNRVILVPGSEAGLFDQAIAYSAAFVALATYLTAAGYLFRAYRRERDPFERNRLKYVGLSTLLITLGLLTNLEPALQGYPIDRSLALVAAFVLYFSLVRYRLFDIDLAASRAIVTLGSVALVTPIYLAALFRFEQVNPLAAEHSKYVVGMVLVFPAVLAVHLLRSRLSKVVNRLLLGANVDADPAADFIARAQTVRGVTELAELIGSVCQQRFEARFTSVLLRSDVTDAIEVVSVQGPFASVVPRSAIELENSLLPQLAVADHPVTPGRLRSFASTALSGDVHQFEAIADCLIQPIIARGALIGIIAVGEPVYDDAYSLSDLRWLTTIAGQAALAVEGARLFEQVQRHADTDFLTGLPNHRRLNDLLTAMLNDADEGTCPFAVAMIDVDNFKLLNDTHGHIAGDDGLKTIADYLRRSVRRDDIVGRYGGDEFMILFPGLDEAQAVQTLTRIARNARRIALGTTGSDQSTASTIPMRLSWGVAVYPGNARSVRTLVGAADSDLLKRRYVRRRAGRVHTDRPSLQRMRENDPRRVRIASGLLEILDAKDNYTTEHSHQVASLSLLLADEMRLSEKDREDLWLGGLLHDIGKLQVPDEVVRKPGALTASEWAEIYEHPVHGARLVAGLFGEGALVEIVGSHHERFDGHGYPTGLSGERIPLLARAVSVCDAYSAMTHDRPYRKGLSGEEAVAELRRGAGRQWDPQLVDAFVRAIGARDAAA